MTFLRTQQPQTIWDEAEMCHKEVVVPPPSRRGLGGRLRAEVSGLGRASGKAHELTRGAAVVFAPEALAHGNFIEASYRRILARADWARRLQKVHTARRQARPSGADEQVRVWKELDAATSSDALLMNVFCYPRVWTSNLRALMGVAGREQVRFGVRSQARLERGLVNTTEIDMHVGDLLVEAKLTEADFQWGALRLAERHVDFAEVFDEEQLVVTRRGIRSYQLVRGVLAAYATGGRFCVICDARRSDLIADWFQVMQAVKLPEVRAGLRLATWQEIAGVVPRRLREFLLSKYGIVDRS